MVFLHPAQKVNWPADIAKAHPNSSFDSIDLMFFAQKAMDSMSYESLEDAIQRDINKRIEAIEAELEMVPA